MPELRYVGPAPVLGCVLLPEGWPSFDHGEPDEDIAAAKVASGNYEYAKPPRPTRRAEGASEHMTPVEHDEVNAEEED